MNWLRTILVSLGLVSGCNTPPRKNESMVAIHARVQEAHEKWSIRLKSHFVSTAEITQARQARWKYYEAVAKYHRGEMPIEQVAEAMLNYVELINRLVVDPVP